MKKIIKLGKHVAPSVAPTVIEEGTLLKIEIFKGGITGMPETLYGQLLQEDTELTHHTFICFKDHFTKQKVTINTDFILTMQERKFVSIKSDLTQNSNFNKKNRASVYTYTMNLDTNYVLLDEVHIEPATEDAQLIHIDYIGWED